MTLLDIDSNANFSCGYCDNFKASVMESRFSSKNGEFVQFVWAFFNPLGNSITCIGTFSKAAFLEISRNSFLTEGLQPPDCNATKGHVWPNFLEVFLKDSKNFKKELCNRVPFK